MNSKKHKNKNRAKVLPTPPQKIDAEAKNTEDVQLVKKSEIFLIPEDVHNTSVNTETEMQVKDEKDLVKDSCCEQISPNTEQTPVKPNRNKGKKKKRNTNEISSENFSDDCNKIELAEGEEIKLKETNPSDLINQENDNVQPSTRKKKNKDKKHHAFSQEFLTVNEFDTTAALLEENVKSNIEDELVVHSANKKNKKKKRRHDSEKSEKMDEKLSCVAAFNDLINVSDPGEVNDQGEGSCQEDIITCIKNPDGNSQAEDVESDLGKSDVTLTKKKKKKEKKHPPKFEQCNQLPLPNTDDEVSNMASSKTTEIVEKDHQTKNISCALKDTILECVANEPKQIATIAKPVKKKIDATLDKYEDMDKAEGNFYCISSDNSKSQEIKVENKKSSAQLGLPVKDSQNLKLPDIIRQTSEDIKSCHEKFNIDECLETTGDTTNLKDDEELDYKIVPNNEFDKLNENTETSAGKLLGGISSFDTKLNEDSRKQQDYNKTESIQEENNNTIQSNKICDNTPDYIQIPRSSSQQLFADNNNNTIIHEFTPNDEMKLGIPVFTSNMIQGSGETPVSTPIITSEYVSVTEIESILDKDQEKTDLKSKMLEVNQELEELKMSLEKSLAEITSIDKSEEDIVNKSCTFVETGTEKTNIKSDDKPVDEIITYKPLADRLNDIENKYNLIEEKQSENTLKQQITNDNESDVPQVSITPPICPSRKDRKGKGKSNKRGRRQPDQPTSQTTTLSGKTKSDESKNELNNEEKSKTSEEKAKQQCDNGNKQQDSTGLDFEPIENFEDALTSSVDDADVNITFEIIANELNGNSQIDQAQKELTLNKPEINITPPMEDTDKEKQQKYVHPVSQPKNLLGHCSAPVPSSKTDYKKEKNKTPNTKQAKVKIKDAVEPEPGAASGKASKQSQTENKIKFNKNQNESFSYVTNEKEEYVYKYSFRKVFLTSVCHVCRKELKQARVACKFCNLLFYCSQKHKDEDWPRHQSLCFAVSTIVHLKDQKHIYSDAKNLSGQNYRLVRMQMILSCEKVLKRKLLPWEQEALLYPRICADVQCREWKQSKLGDCDKCGQVSYCIENPQHLPASHQRWCKSYALYQKLVLYQESNGRLEPKLPGKVMIDEFVLPGKINEVLASMYNERIDMTDIQYAALTQLATAPLTTAFCYQTFRQLVNSSNGFSKKSTFTVHVVGADLQFEADSLNKWEVFLLHLKPDVQILRVDLVGHELNPSNLPLDLLGKINLCECCREGKRRVQISFQDKPYKEYWSGDEFNVPDIVCAFNPSIQRSSTYDGGDYWPATINCILKQKVPFLITSHTLEELSRDMERIKESADVNYKVVVGPNRNPFASFRPDRNFITDEETPLLFKNYCFSILYGV